jgi:hypothetical protein
MGGLEPPPGLPIFNTPEDMLAEPLIASAVAALQKLPVGATFRTNLNHTPPDLVGTYTSGDSAIVATSDGIDVGAGLGVNIAKISSGCQDVLGVDKTRIANGVTATATVYEYVRGSGQSYGTYSLAVISCPGLNGDFSFVQAGVASAQIDSVHSTQASDELFVTVATQGEIAPACATALAPSIRSTGGWLVVGGTASISR